MENVKILGTTPVVKGETNEGARGKKNEDRYGYFDAPGTYGQPIAVLVVADGVTSTSGGAQASEIAVTRIQEYLEVVSPRSLPERMVDAVRQANQDIVAMAEEHPDWKGMSTTIVVSAIENDTLYTVHMGDSRTYLLRGDEIHQLTVDHTWVQDAIDAGRLQPEEAASHPNRHVIQRFMGIQRGLAVDQTMIKLGEQDLLGDERTMVTSIALEPDDAVLLCSDGLYNRVRREELLSIARRYPGQPDKAIHQMIDQAVRRQEPDNITAVMLTTQAAPAVAALPGGRRGLGIGLAAALAALALLALFLIRPWAGSDEPEAIVASSPPAEQSTGVSVGAGEAALAPEDPPVDAAPSAEPSPEPPTATPLAPAQIAETAVAATADAAIVATVEAGTAAPAGVAMATSTRVGEEGVTESVIPSDTLEISDTVTASVSAVTTTTVSVAATSTPLATSTPVPTVTPTATPTPTRRASATATATPNTSQAPPPSGEVRLLEPLPNESLDGSGRKVFRWTPLPNLPETYLYELVFWRIGEDGFEDGRSPVGASNDTSAMVDLGEVDSRFGSLVDPGTSTCWGVRLWDTNVDREVRMVSDCRLFTYAGSGGGGDPSDPGKGAGRD